MELTICGGDIRQIYMAHALRQKGYDVRLTLFEKAANEKNEGNTKKAVRGCDILLLPLPVSRSGKTVNAPFSDTELPVGNLAALLGEGQIVLGGMLPFTLAEALEEKNIPYFDYYKDETLITRNAVPTAEGVLGLLIQKTPVTICSSSCLITGYGRCGKAIAALLQKNGAAVTVAARSPSARKEAAENGCAVLSIDELADAPAPFDAVVNTIPHRVIEKELLQRLKKETVLVEISSAPFGIDFDSASQLGLQIIKAASLPGKVSPKTAGEIIADTVDRLIQQYKEEI